MRPVCCTATVAAALSLVTAVLIPRPTGAQADPFDACVRAAVEVMRESGGVPQGSPTRTFLVEGESHTEPLSLERAGCIGLLAVGHRQVRDLDVSLHTASGMELQRDVAMEPYSYVHYCGGPQLELVATVQMYKGQGEMRLIRFSDAPPVLPDLTRRVGQCFGAASGVVQPSVDVGPEPAASGLEETRRRVRESLEHRGYRHADAQRGGPLGTRQVARRSIELAAGRCYALAGTGGALAADVDLVLRSADTRPLARDMSRARDAVAKVCVERSGSYDVEIRMYQGRGEWGLDVYVLDEPPGDRPPGIDASARIDYAEAVARLGRYGMSAEPLGWGMLRPGESLSMPVSLEAGRCYALAGVAGRELSDGDLDLVLLDDTGRLVAWDLSARPDPLLFHCPERGARYRVVGKVFGSPGRYLVLVGRDGPHGGPS